VEILRILIADDDRLVCQSINIILQSKEGVEVAGLAYSGEEAIERYRELRPDILLMDIRMGGMTGLEAAERILTEFRQARIIFLTTFSDREYIIKALALGAKGYLIKQNIESIPPALSAVMAGQSVFGGEIIAAASGLIGQTARPPLSSFGLTEREIEVITEVSAGRSNKEIADKLFLSEGTVRNYLSAVLQKLNLRDRTQLAIFYRDAVE